MTTPPPETPGTGDGQTEPDEEPRTVPPEEQQGDEEAIRSEAVFTGKGGRLTPREIRVPAFIAIRVILRSTERPEGYSLEIGGQRLAIGHAARDRRDRARRPAAGQVVRGQEPAGQRPHRGVRRTRALDSSA